MRIASGSLVGRDDDLRAVLDSLRAQPAGRPGVVTVSGQAGIGKTRFVRAVADRLRAEHGRVLTGACLDLRAGGSPYAAFINAFRSSEPPAVHLLDALTGAVDMPRPRLLELLRSTLVALARTRPTVLVVEDLHWSDKITRDTLAWLLAMTREGRWTMIVTYRDDEVDARPAVREFLDVLDRGASVQVHLEPLAQSDVARQVQDIVGAPV